MDLKKPLVELIGTLFLVMVIGFAITGGAGVMAPVAIGAILMAMVYAGGHVSGAHYNPAVTLALVIRGKATFGEAIGYWLAQFIGAALGAYIVCSTGTCAAAAGKALTNPGLVISLEALCTFALTWVVLNVATAPKNTHNSFYGLAIGFTVVACAYAVGGITGGAFNPAVAIGAGIMHLLNFADIWMHIVGDFLGGIVAAYVYIFINGKD